MNVFFKTEPYLLTLNLRIMTMSGVKLSRFSFISPFNMTASAASSWTHFVLPVAGNSFNIVYTVGYSVPVGYRA